MPRKNLGIVFAVAASFGDVFLGDTPESPLWRG